MLGFLDQNFYKNEESPWGNKPTFFLKQILPLLKKGTVLDIGGGDGKNTLYLTKHGFEVTNLDSNQRALEMCEMRAREDNLTIKTQLIDLENSEISGNYDNFICFWTLHYLNYETGKKLINDMIKNVIEGGTISLVAYTNKGSYYEENPSNFFFEENGALKAFEALNILRYEKKMGGSKVGSGQERIFLAVRAIKNHPVS